MITPFAKYFIINSWHEKIILNISRHVFHRQQLERLPTRRPVETVKSNVTTVVNGTSEVQGQIGSSNNSSTGSSSNSQSLLSR